MKKLLYACEADAGGIMEYAIRQSAALVRAGIEVDFLCKETFPKERLAEGIRVREFVKSRGTRDEGRATKKQPRGVFGKVARVLKMLADLRSEARQVAELAEELANESSTRNPSPANRHNLGTAGVCVLFACYKEYFAPFWVQPLKRLAQRGVVIGTIAHDPVRDFVVGPLWWHRWSVRLGYSFVRYVFVHDDTPVDFGGKQPEGIRIHQIPHGPYEVAEPKIGPLEMRRRLGFSATKDANRLEMGKIIDSKNIRSSGGNQLDDSVEFLDGRSQASLPMVSQKRHTLCDAKASDASGNHSSSVPIREIRGSYAFALDSGSSALETSAPEDIVFLAFGQIRDGKNLDLFLRAMTQLPEHVKLLVAGKGDSGSSRPAEYYQKLAEELGVAERCRWDIRRIPEDEVGDIFAACDVVLVTYSAKFRSASGVLNAAISARKPVLASSGSGPLKTVVSKYNLGVFVGPDDLKEILRGAMQLAICCQMHANPPPAWSRYESENSWEENARRVVKIFEA
jgi:glycosyltransferase involved in cell wall biosynthesis